MLGELRDLVSAEIADAPLKVLIENLLGENEAALKLLPGSLNRYHPFAGGWLEHTLSVARSCVWLADKYAAQFPALPFLSKRGTVGRLPLGSPLQAR